MKRNTRRTLKPARWPIRWARLTRPLEATRPGRLRAFQTGTAVKLRRRWLQPFGLALVQ